MSARRRVVLREIAWDDEAGAGLRTAMAVEMGERYSDVMRTRIGSVGPVPSASDVLIFLLAVDEDSGEAVGCAALRDLDGTAELKRMYVAPSHRGHGIGSVLLRAIEDTARKLGHERIVLQTGDRQQDAVSLYEKSGYHRIPVLEAYRPFPESLCFERSLAAEDDGEGVA